MTLKSASHSVYEIEYHLVWCSKYRKKILVGNVRKRVKEIFYKIADEFEFEIDRGEVAEDDGYILLRFPPRYSISKVVGIMKSITASKIFEEFPGIKKQLWRGKLWEQGYFVRTAGEHMTDKVIRQYMEKHSSSYEQPRL